MKVISTILILARATYSDKSCTEEEGTCLLQLRNKVEDLQAGLEHANHDVEYWKKRMQLLKLRRSEITSLPTCAECPQGSDLCEGQERSGVGFGMRGGEDVHMCRHDETGALCAYECERLVSFVDGSADASTEEEFATVPPSDFGDGFSIEVNEASSSEPEEIPECPGQDQHLHITSKSSCEKHGAVMRAKDGTNLEDYFWDNVRIKEVKYKVDGETLQTHQELTDYNFTKKPAGDNSPHHVEVMVKDVGNFEVMCRRDVYVDDDAPPTWLDPPEPSHDAPHTLEFRAGEDCSRTADELFDWYEQNRSVTWDPIAVDNCQGVDGQPPTVYREVYRPKVVAGNYVQELVYSEDPNNLPPTEEVYIYIGEQFLMLKYYAVDASGTRMETAEEHTVNIHLKDNIAPSKDDVFCPAKFHVTLLHNESTATVQWSVPRVLSDNCPPTQNEYPIGQQEARTTSHGTFPEVAETTDANGHPALVGHFAPGTYEVDYSLRDSNGNLYPHECEMIIEVEQYASPVHLECPDEVPAAITGKKNYAPVSWQEPNHNNGKAHQDNNPVNVSYKPEGVVPGMAFPWGTTSITVVATGSGSVAEASHNVAECTFVVSVTDERPPELWGKQYHCRKLPNGETAPGVAPFRLCEAQKHLNVKEHPSYLDTGGYTIEGVGTLPYKECCNSEAQDGTIIPHQCHWESDLISYCGPTSADPHGLADN